jgi:hypothetical protein
MEQPLRLNLINNIRCRIHPVVLLSILDHHVRRPQNNARVIGTLVGEYKEGLVDIRNCFAVPHEEGENVGFSERERDERQTGSDGRDRSSVFPSFFCALLYNDIQKNLKL